MESRPPRNVVLCRWLTAGMACLLLAAGSLGTSTARAEELKVVAPAYEATITNGGLSSLRATGGAGLVRPDADPSAAVTIHRVAGDVRATTAVKVPRGPADADRGFDYRYEGFEGLDRASVDASFAVQVNDGDLTITQRCTSESKGVWGVSWATGRIPLECAIIVPGQSGIRLTADGPGGAERFDYPMGWEAQFVIVERLGGDGGFWVWAEDEAGRYKRLVVDRNGLGWQLRFITINDAPFDALTECRSVRWHVNTYKGDWRVPAGRYRTWMREHYHPALLDKQQPAWVKDMRACIIMGPDLPMLEALRARFDGPQTLLYLPQWRSPGYDRNYPDYENVIDQLAPFVRRAHELGFRVMLHVNYFGVDPLHPAYEKFEPFQVRSSWGKHEKEWWTWDRATPTIKFAYINPALRAWRELFVGKMRNVVARTAIDALHLDQTLCIYNDNNGRIDGMTMIEGNLALHRELREALPEVAISGEGLNEVTCRYEAFAQRHARGLNHAEGTWDSDRLRQAHPICSYLFLPHTKIYGYLGYTSPRNDQLYGAWNEAYQHWGVIPTLKPMGTDATAAGAPGGFLRQLFEEIAFWQQRRVDPDMDGPWPAGVVFPYRTADGRAVQRTADGRTVSDGRIVSWTLSGANTVEAAGTIPGWRAFDAQRLIGLDPECWYPCFAGDARDEHSFHIAAMPPNLIAAAMISKPEIAMVCTRPVTATVADLVHLLDRAACGSRPFEAPPSPVTFGPLHGADGATFAASSGNTLMVHPPFKAPRLDPKTGQVKSSGGTGVAFARYAIKLPAAGTENGSLRFESEVVMGPNTMSPGRSDGVTFAVAVRASSGPELRQQVHCASESPVPLALDLAPLAGREVVLELSVDPGPKRNANFDQGRWLHPRVQRQGGGEANIELAGPDRWALALSGTRLPQLRSTPQGTCSVRLALPGTLYLLRNQPRAAELPMDVLKWPRVVAFVSDAGMPLENPPSAGASPTQVMVGGVRKTALRAHPPDHGRTMVCLPMVLPKDPAVFRAFVGIADGAKSSGVIFIVEANGQELVRKRMLPGPWEEVTADLSPWAGQPVVLSLITDSDGPYSFDWAHWGEPRMERRP